MATFILFGPFHGYHFNQKLFSFLVNKKYELSYLQNIYKIFIMTLCLYNFTE